jgi:hypothetical protein
MFSYLNDCFYCHHSHGEIACINLGGDRELVEQVRKDYTKGGNFRKIEITAGYCSKSSAGRKSLLRTEMLQMQKQMAPKTETYTTRTDCCCILYVQQVRRWISHHHADRYVILSAKSKADG